MENNLNNVIIHEVNLYLNSIPNLINFLKLYLLNIQHVISEKYAKLIGKAYIKKYEIHNLLSVPFYKVSLNH